MEPPDPIAARLDDEPVEAVVSLGGDDAVAVTPTRTLVYRAEGLLRDESIAEYPHDVDRVTCSVGRRKATVGMVYVDETREFTVPKDAVDDVLAPVVGGVLGAAGAIDADAGEAVADVLRFSELTLVVTDRRVIKHVGAALWDEEYESYDYADVTDLAVEEGTVATQLVLEVDGRPRRIKTPSDRARQVRRAIEDELLAYHGVESVEDLPESDAESDGPADEGNESESESESAGGEADDGQTPEAPTAPDDGGPDASAAVEPLLDAPEESDDSDADTPASAEATGSAGDAGPAESGAGAGGDGDVDGVTAADDADEASDEAGGFRFGKSPDDDEVAARLSELTAAVERQNELLERQQETIQRLVEELRRGR